MTGSYDDIVEWVERKLSKKFKDYRDLGEFRDDFRNVSLVPGDSRNASFSERLDEYLDGTLKPETRPDYEDVREAIEDNKIEDIEDMEKEEAENELSDMKKEDYTKETISKVEAIVSDKSEDTEDAKELREEAETGLTKAETQEDIGNLPTAGELRRTLGLEAAQVIIDRIGEKSDELESLSREAEKDIRGEIASADTEEELRDIDVNIPDTTASMRRELSEAISDKISGLE